MERKRSHITSKQVIKCQISRLRDDSILFSLHERSISDWNVPPACSDTSMGLLQKISPPYHQSSLPHPPTPPSMLLKPYSKVDNRPQCANLLWVLDILKISSISELRHLVILNGLVWIHPCSHGRLVDWGLRTHQCPIYCSSSRKDWVPCRQSHQHSLFSLPILDFITFTTMRQAMNKRGSHPLPAPTLNGGTSARSAPHWRSTWGFVDGCETNIHFP